MPADHATAHVADLTGGSGSMPASDRMATSTATTTTALPGVRTRVSS